MGPVVDGEGSKRQGCFIAAIVLQAALLALMVLFWMVVVSHPSDDPEDARAGTYVDVSMVASLVAFGGVVAASVTLWSRWLLVAAAGASYVAVAAGFASGVDLMISATILLAVLPSGLLLIWWLDHQ
jgi:hypothetical protein